MPCNDPNCACHTMKDRIKEALENVGGEIDMAETMLAARQEALGNLPPEEAQVVTRTSERLEALLNDVFAICKTMEWPALVRVMEVKKGGIRLHSATALPPGAVVAAMCSKMDDRVGVEFADMAMAALECEANG